MTQEIVDQIETPLAEYVTALGLWRDNLLGTGKDRTSLLQPAVNAYNTEVFKGSVNFPVPAELLVVPFHYTSTVAGTSAELLAKGNRNIDQQGVVDGITEALTCFERCLPRIHEFDGVEIELFAEGVARLMVGVALQSDYNYPLPAQILHRIEQNAALLDREQMLRLSNSLVNSLAEEAILFLDLNDDTSGIWEAIQASTLAVRDGSDMLNPGTSLIPQFLSDFSKMKLEAMVGIFDGNLLLDNELIDFVQLISGYMDPEVGMTEFNRDQLIDLLGIPLREQTFPGNVLEEIADSVLDEVYEIKIYRSSDEIQRIKWARLEFIARLGAESLKEVEKRSLLKSVYSTLLEFDDLNVEVLANRFLSKAEQGEAFFNIGRMELYLGLPFMREQFIELTRIADILESTIVTDLRAALREVIVPESFTYHELEL